MRGLMTGPELGHDIIGGTGEPRAWIYFLHGIYGAGRNWGTIARRLVEARPGWGAVLVDLRQHGASQGFPPPNTIEAAAADLTRLEKSIGRPAAAVLGHSFGGKVALQQSLDPPSAPRQVWVVDSTPQAGPPSGSAWRMLEVVRALPAEFDGRADAVAALESNGIDRPVAQWMATNLERHDGRLRWRFDLAAIEELLRDFFRTELWGAVERPTRGVEVHVVKATRSSTLSGETLARVEQATLTRVHRVEGGHWLNADSPDAMVALLGEWLPAR
jgi:pimeloyl-ACP methyl ester carboxylesterase